MSGPRLFDPDEAAQRYAAGESQAVLAQEYGVTESAVWQQLRRRDPAGRTKLNRYSREWQRENRRRPCIDGCGRIAWHTPGRPGRCVQCEAARKATTVAPDELLCANCHTWKPDEDFPRSRVKKARRGRHATCKTCQAEAKRAWRARNRVACEGCGKKIDPDPARTYGLCRECWTEARRNRTLVRA